MQVGTFRLVGEEFRGELRTLTMTAELAFVPVYGSKGSMAPSHVVVANGVEVGTAWPAGPEAGVGLKVRIDDPTFPAPLVGTLSRLNDESFVLVWRRPSWRG
ncbi:DUF736 domain-containing protein [Acidocella sp.]|uniref:DUF736 domain-containing protein n=1 Tax=Acidocella sp. TaxID=50710 RepID=UPI00262A86BA|nr:DUF736 domain-containing protein [Acidocella sp.]MDD2794670.1 DUF736 domain-containing protein [Acidocella sp.]